MFKVFCGLIRKSTIFVIDPQQIGGDVIITYEYILPAVITPNP